MTDCNDFERAFMGYCASGPCLIEASPTLLIKTVMAPETSILPVTSNVSYFITKKKKKAHSCDTKGVG